MEQAHERYRAERAKRLRGDGNDQYTQLEGNFPQFETDPWADPDLVRESVVESAEAVIVGAGFAGMLTAIELTRRGIRDFRIVEKGSDFGGTWYWNRYPGCMCDVESMTYMPLLEETGYRPTERYASAVEIFAYCQQLGRHFDLYPHALFQTEIADSAWDESDQRWRIETTRGDRLTAKFFVLAGGLLHKAKMPAIDGIDRFDGHAFHTSRWDYAFTGGSPTEPMHGLGAKTVGIIGTGATAIQVVPKLAETAEKVYVFQRTPAAVGVRDNGPVDPAWFDDLEPGWQARRVRNFTEVVSGKNPDQDLVADGWSKLMAVDCQKNTDDPDEIAELERLDFETMESLRARVDAVIEDPETAAKLKPWWGKHCKRICFHDEYLQSFNRPNVELVDTDGRGVREMGKRGPIIDGVEYPVDALVFASGFEVTTDLDKRLGFDPRGRSGIALSDRWHDGAHTLHGVLSADFPNMAIISIVQAGFGVNYIHFLGESAKHVAWIIDECERQGIAEIEATPEAEEEWLAVLYAVVGGVARYSQFCTPSYYNGEGSRTAKAARNLTYVESMIDYVGHLERWRDAGDFPGARIVLGVHGFEGVDEVAVVGAGHDGLGPGELDIGVEALDQGGVAVAAEGGAEFA